MQTTFSSHTHLLVDSRNIGRGRGGPVSDVPESQQRKKSQFCN